MSQRIQHLVVIALLLTQAAFLAWQGWRYSPTIDEPAHLVAGISHWQFHRFDLYRANPPLVRLVASIPILFDAPRIDWTQVSSDPYQRPEFPIGLSYVQRNGAHCLWHHTLARWACIPLVLIGGYFCYRWAGELYGSPSGLVALVLWCFCPNVLGNGALITPDAAATSFGVASGYFFWKWLQRASWSKAGQAGVFLGIALLTKTTWVVLLGLWPALWLIWMLHLRFSPSSAIEESGNAASSVATRKAGLRDQFVQLMGILALGLYIVNIGYGFEQSVQPLGSFRFVSQALGGASAHQEPGNKFSETWVGRLPVVLPANYLRGIDTQLYDFEVGKYSYLRGEQRMGGWWYYYCYALAVKLPLGTIALLLVACWTRSFAMFRRWLPNAGLGDQKAPIIRHSPWDDLILLAPALAVLLLVSSQTGFTRYFRYVLPITPFLFIWASQPASLIKWGVVWRLVGDRKRSIRMRARRAAFAIFICGCILAVVVGSVCVLPHSLSFFNILAGGASNGHLHLLDANVDWGQDLRELKWWRDKHCDSEPFYLAYFGPVDPRLVGISYDPMPTTDHVLNPSNNAPSSIPNSGWYAVSVNELHGYKHYGQEKDIYSWLRYFEPAATAGYSIHIYHITLDDANRVRKELGLPEFRLGGQISSGGQAAATAVECVSRTEQIIVPNAAVHYWEGIYELYEFYEVLNPRQVGRHYDTIEHCLTAPLDAHATVVVERCERALACLYRGVKLRYCDFLIPFDEFGAMHLDPHLGRSNMLAKAACLRARLRLHDGHTQRGVDDLKAVLVLSQHVGNEGRDGSFALLTESAIEFLAVEVASAHLCQLGQEEVDSFVQRIQLLPNDCVLETVVAKEEKLWADWHISYARRAMNGGEWNPNWLNTTLNLPDENEEVVAIKKAVAGEAKNLARLAASAKSFYREARRIMMLPRQQYDREWPQLIEKARAENPLAWLGLTNIKVQRARWDETQVRRVLFREAVQLIYHRADPMKTRDCTYQATDDGFVLRSSVQDLAGRPIETTFCTPKK